MKILITGGRGFIGRNLTEHLLTEHEVHAPAHKELDLLDEDAVRSFLREERFETIIHSAVKPGHRNAKDPENQFFHNTRMFYNLARNDQYYDKLLFMGSGLVYDQRHYLPKMKEEYFDAHMPADEGGFSKYIISRYISGKENMTDLRVFGIFGKYEDYAIRFISNAICKTLLDLPITIKKNRRFDYIYIDDYMPIIDHFIKKKTKERAYNITPDKPIELKTLAEKVLEISGKNLPIKIGQDGMGPEYSGDNTRLRKEIPNLKFTPMDESIGKLYGWYSQNRRDINKEFLMVDK
jgi:GDP-L-fucose synthase